MMKMKTKGILCVAAAMLAMAGAAKSAAKGSCISKAKALAGSQNVTLVEEYDSEEKELLGSGVMYYTVTLKRGQAYTVWITGGNASEMSLEIDPNWEYYDKEKNEDKEPSCSFDIDEYDGGDLQVGYLYADDWTYPEAGDEKGDYDPKEAKFVVAVYGDIGASTTLGFMRGIRNFTLPGTDASPKALTFSNSWKSFTGKLIDGEYYFRATLKGGRKYRVRTLAGTASLPLEMDIDDGSGNSDEDDDSENDEMDEEITEDSAYTNVVGNVAYLVTPSVNGKYTFVVSGDTAQNFKFSYRAVPTRAIASHPSIPLLAENGYSATFVPGKICNTNNYYDDIIDDHLCKIYLPKGARWVFETEGATVGQRMYAYSPAGNVLAMNETVGGGDANTRVVITATTAGVYYVGVCDPTLDVDTPYDTTVPPITLTARDVTSFPVPDTFDPVDDAASGANRLVPWPATTNDSAVAVTLADDNGANARTLGAIHGPHLLSVNDPYDVFAIACRKGYTYRLTTTWADENDTTDLSLGAKVFYLAGTKERAVATTGSLDPSDTMELTFTPTVSGIHYVRVYVAEGTGLDYPGYNIHAMVANGTNTLGFVKVNADGGVGTWTINAETITYPYGSVLALKAPNSALKVNFGAVAGFTATPASTIVDLPVWNPGDAPIAVNGVYGDAYDKKYIMSYTTKTVTKNGKKTTTKTPNYSPADGDGTAAGAFAITPAAKVATIKRTLWEADPADHFSFTAAAGVYYNFTLTGTDNARMVLSNATDGVVAEAKPLADGAGVEIAKVLVPAGKTYLVVTHGDGAEKNVCYSLTHSKASPGIVRFTNAKSVATSAFSVKEGVEYATLYVARTGTEGATRVKYATQAGTALPGTNYYPVADGEISWAAGDKAAKPIKIRMIPDSIAHWASSNLTFSVVLYPADEYELAANEYLARTNTPQIAKVTILEATAKKPGKIALASFDAGVGAVAVANAAKPVPVGTAGSPLTLTFSRIGGADGKVSVKVATTPLKTDTAKAGVDYVAKSETLVWEDGDDSDRTVELDLKPVAGYTATKKFNLAFTIVKTGFTPTLAAKTATVTIKNAVLDQTAAAYAKTFGSAGLALATTGTWFKDYSGDMRSASAAGTCTYTLTGPGFFMCRPKVVKPAPEDAATLTCQVDKEAAIDCTAADFGGTIARVLPSGKHTVKFTLAGVAVGAYASFENESDGKPYLWVPLSATVADEPMTKAVVTTNQTSLAWSLPVGVAGRAGIHCRVRFGTAATAMTAIGYTDSTATTIAIPSPLVAGKAYYWAVDTAYTESTSPTDEEIATLKYATGATWTFSALKAGAPVTAIAPGKLDAAGEEIADLVADGKPVELIQGVKPEFGLEGTGETGMVANGFRFVAGTLPKGLSVNATTGALTGAPSTPGTYRALVQGYNKLAKTTSKKVNGKTVKTTTYTYTYGTTLPVVFEVLPAGTSIGTFRAALEEDGDTFGENARRFGTLSLTVSSAGKISSSVTIGGVAYSFTGTGFDEIVDRDETLSGHTRRFRVRLTNKTLINKKTATYNYLTITLGDGPTTNAVALAEAMGTVELEMNVANPAKTAVVKNVFYRGDLYRNNGATELGKAAIGDFVGYYTVGLVPEGVTPADGIPAGNGYLTLTVAAANSVKISGVLADGTAVSGSSIGQLVGDSLESPRECALFVPVFFGKTTVYSIAGVVKIAYENPSDANALPVALPTAKLVWAKSAAAATSRDASGFAISIAPTGGWYNTTENMQAHYLNNTFALQTVESGDDLPVEALPSGYSFMAASAPHDMAVRFAGNALATDARKLVTNKTTGLYDFWQTGDAATSINPWAVTFKFTRATGLISGTLSVWEWIVKDDGGHPYATKQRQVTKLAHKGVWMWTRDASSESPLAAEACSAGFFIMPATKSWKASLPFNILSVSDDEPSWEEKDLSAPDTGD